MNVKMAIDMASEDGIDVKTVLANDDVPSSPREQRSKRRGVAGEVLMWKIGGAKAAMGGTLNDVISAAQKGIDSTRSVGIGLSPCTIPAVGHPNFKVDPGKMEVGIGHHGEPGLEVVELESAEQMAARMVEIVLLDLPFQSGDEVVVLISGLAACRFCYSAPVMFRSTHKTSMIGGEGWELQWKSRTRMTSRDGRQSEKPRWRSAFSKEDRVQ